MIDSKQKNTKKQLAAARVRSRIHGTAERPRMSVHVSLKNLSAQLINDDASHTIAAISTLSEKSLAKKTMSEKAQWVGEQIALKAKEAKIEKVVFDRGSKRYHGRVAILADAARKAGLTI